MKPTIPNRAQRRRLKRSGVRSAWPWQRLALAGLSIVVMAGIATIAILSRGTVPPSAGEAPIYAPLHIGASAPSFTVTTIDGQRIDSATMSGPILLEVFATWCPHCQHETAILKALHAKAGRRLTIVAVSGSPDAANGTSPGSADDVRAFARYFGVTYAVAYDPDLSVAKNYLQGGFPTIVFINDRSRIAAIESGEVPLKKLIADARTAGVRQL